MLTSLEEEERRKKKEEDCSSHPTGIPVAILHSLGACSQLAC
ncbi:hypothetical protein HU200_008115 [Digitaria exilis]|uniref:Uncharacterized protein n=1 Tax=Digitaria exilis TaxID=1010633 RepID=A0A835FMY0_9POAL|nr:hypothetical protein HU200_008115 [Digitaria exilis]